MVVLTKLTKFLIAAAVFLEAWHALISGWLPITLSPQLYQAILPVRMIISSSLQWVWLKNKCPTPQIIVIYLFFFTSFSAATPLCHNAPRSELFIFCYNALAGFFTVYLFFPI